MGRVVAHCATGAHRGASFILGLTLLGAITTPAGAQPDLAIGKSHTGNFTYGANGTYLLTVTNGGTSSTLAATTVLDTLPPGLTFVSGVGSGWTCNVSGQIVTCVRPGLLAPGDTTSLLLTAAVGLQAVPSVVNSASVSTFSDVNPANDRASDPTTVDVVDLLLDKRHAGDFTVASNGDYEITVANIGTAATFAAITVVDTLPPGLTFVAASGSGWSSSASGQVVTCTHSSSLVPGDSALVTITVLPGDPAVPGVVNRASVSTTGDFDPLNNADDDPTIVNGRPDLWIDKSHTGNFVVTQNENYLLTVGNSGSATTTGAITVVDTLPNGLTYVSGSGSGWSFGASGQVVTGTRSAPLAAGDSTVIVLTVNVEPAAFPQVTNSATVSAAGDPNPANDRDSDPTTIASGSDLAINKSHIGIFTVGVDGTYTLTAANIGSAATAGQITMQDVLPSGLTFVSGSGPGWTCSALGPVVTCTHPGLINPADSTSITLVVAVDPAAVPSVNNIAAVAVAADIDPDNNVDADPTVVTPVNLELAKSHSGNFVAGTNGVYDFLVTNVGVDASGGVMTVADTLPAGLTFVSGTGTGWSFNASGQVVTCTNASPLAPSSSTAFNITVSVGGAAAPGVTNTAEISGGGDGSPANNRAADPTTVLATDLAIAKSHAGDFQVGVNGTYTMTVTNLGTMSTFGSVALVDTLPAGLTFVSGSGAGWSSNVSGQVVNSTYSGAITPGDSTVLALTVAVSAPAVPGVTNRAHVSTAGDSEPSNNTASDPTTVIGEHDLAIAKNHAGNLQVGTNGIYTLTVTNAGSAPTTGAITVSDTLPAGLTYVSGNGAGWSFGVSGQVVTAIHPGPLAPAGNLSFTITVAVGSAAAPAVTNNAHVSTPGDLNNSNDTDSDPTTVLILDLAIAKTHPADFVVGTNGTYTLTVTNAGTTSTTSAITVADTLPAGLTFVSGSGAGWSFAVSGQAVTATHLALLGSGGNSSFTLTVAVDAAAMPSVVNTAEVSTSNDANGTNDRDSDPTTVNDGPAPDLTVNKAHGADFVAGTNGTYTLTVTNLGDNFTTGAITVADTLPAGLTFVSGSGAGWSFAVSGQVVNAIHLGPLAPAGSSNFTITVAVDAAAVPGVVNTAEVSTANDANMTNNRASDPTTVNPGPAPDLAMSKTHPGDFIVDTYGTYTLTVTNVGGAPTTGAISVADTLPVGLTFVSGSGAGWTFAVSGQVVTAVHLGPLAPAGTSSFTLTVAVGSVAAPGVVNAATVSGSDDSDPSNDGAQDSTTVRYRAALWIDKVASRTLAEIGGVVDYRLRVRNPGTDSVAAVVVNDILPAGFIYEPGSARLDGAPFADPSSNGPALAFGIGTLLAGATRELSYRLTVGPAAPLGDGVNRAQAVSAPDSVVSNIASVAVRLIGGPFSDEGVIFGKVFIDRDCDEDRVQTPEDLGIPGVRVVLEDGTAAITDVEGKYHFEGVSPRLHVVHVDVATLPAGAELVVADHRHANDPASRLVDLRKGEFHKADFVEDSGSPRVLQAVIARREQGEVRGAIADSLVEPDHEAPRLIALGVLEGRIDFHSLDLSKVVPALRHDGFAEELRDLAVEADDEQVRGAARGALYLKGKIKGDYLLTVAADSEREDRERLFRDIRPDEFYPVYGDASIKEFDAQSADRLYARVDRGRSYLLYGDYETPDGGEARALGAYQRSLTGLTHHLESGPATVNTFASEGRARQIVDELPGRGVSGPYALSRTDGVVNSEKVEILTRDRDQPSRVLRSVPQRRFLDYQLEPFSGRLVFKVPVPSVDEELNPIFIRITYEVEEAADRYLLYGAEARVRVAGVAEIGVAAVNDENPGAPRELVSANAGLELGGGTALHLEVSQSDSADARRGAAGRAEIVHHSSRLDARLFGSRTEAAFANPSAPLSPGRIELGGQVVAAFDSSTKLALEALRTEDDVTGGRRDGGDIEIERRFGEHLSLALGYRHAEETAAPASAAAAGTTPNHFNAARGRAGLRVPGLESASLFGEYEQDVSDAERFRALTGGEYEFNGRGRLYARQEWIASFAGAYALHPDRRLSTTVVGFDSRYHRGGQAFSEYRVRDAFSSREAEAAIGLRNRWMPRAGLRLDASFERVTPLEGSGPNEATAVTAAAELTRSPRWKASGRGEFRTSPAGDDVLASAGYGRKLSRNLSLLGKALWSDQGSLDQTNGRGQLGVAYRQTDTDRWNALTRYEYRFEERRSAFFPNTEHDAHVLALDVHQQPRRRLVLSEHVAGKIASDRGNDIETTTQAWWLGVRSMVDLAKRWDAGLQVSSLFSDGFASHRDGAGLELGYLAATNLRVAAGYNLFGFHDEDLTPDQRTDHGGYLHIGFKFDEDLFGMHRGPGAAPGDSR